MTLGCPKPDETARRRSVRRCSVPTDDDLPVDTHSPMLSLSSSDAPSALSHSLPLSSPFVGAAAPDRSLRRSVGHHPSSLITPRSVDVWTIIDGGRTCEMWPASDSEGLYAGFDGCKVCVCVFVCVYAVRFCLAAACCDYSITF